MPGLRKLSWQKRILFRAVLAALVVGFIELMSLIYLNFSFGYQLDRRHTIAKSIEIDMTENFNFPLMIHPYIGMVLQPRKVSTPVSADKLRVTEYGFLDDRPPLRKRAAGKVIVGLLGGSVARQLATTSTAVLERELSKIGQYQGHTFEFVRLAIDGQKQPQHLMTLNYLLSLGGEFDLLINLDGVNELSLPGMDNVPFGVSAAYPRKWGAITNSTSSTEVMRQVGRLTFLREARLDCARWFDTFPLRYSPTATLIWSLRNRHFDQVIDGTLSQIDNRLQHEELTYCSSGPPEKFDSEEQLLLHCTDIWARSSILMQGLCHANQIRYFHFLQPNQYLAKSKPIGSEEQGVAISKESPFARPVTIGYPLLRARAAQLAAGGVDFTDLTQVFANHPEPLYRDDCCHVTPAGDEIIATAIAARIKAWHEQQAAEHTSVNQIP